MAKRISEAEFKFRLKRAYPDADLEVINYTAISNPVDIKCKGCGKEFHFKKADRAITNLRCCFNDGVRKLDRIIDWLNKSEDFEYIKQIDGEYILIKHVPCGNIFKKNIQKFWLCPEACSHCDTQRSKLTLSVYDAQKVLDKRFFGDIKLVQYNGRHEKCLYRCSRCNRIFKQKFDCLLGSSGCPKCDRQTSLGEKKMRKLLQKAGLIFREQVRVEELPRQRFDFAVYLNKDDDEPYYFIEVQGQQHYEPVDYWGGEKAFADIEERDERKRKYCKKYHIPLYEIVYQSKKFKNLDILPFDTTTISAQESRE